MEVREGYKLTEVGMIPEDWDVLHLRELLKIRHGKSQHEVENINGLYPVLGTGGEIGRTDSFLYNKPSVLIGRKGTIDKPRYMETPFWTVDTLFYSEVNEIVDAKFLFYKFNLIDWYLYNEASGVPSLNAKTIENIQIALPLKKPEQQAIAQTLSDTDALIDALEKLIEKKRHIKQGAMQELLTGKRRLPGFEVKQGYKLTEIGEIPEDWEVAKIEDVCTISTGNKNTQDKVENGKYPFFVRSQTIERINSYTYDKEAVLTAGDGVGTGKVFHYVNGKFDLHQRVYVMSDFLSIDGYFFYLYFSNNFYERISQMTAKSSVDSVRREMIANMLIPIPSTEEQQVIATVLADIGEEIESLESKLQKTKEIKDGMMHELLTGKIRLIPSGNEVT